MNWCDLWLCGVWSHFTLWYYCNVSTFVSVVVSQSFATRGFMIQEWCCLLCCLKPFLDEKVLSQRLQGMMIPSRWFASMWSLMWGCWPSFPHTLHRFAKFRFLPATRFWLFSIIDFTLSSSSTRSPENSVGMANVLFSPGFWILLLGFCFLKELFLKFVLMAGENVSYRGFSSSKSLTFSCVFPIKPFSWSSSATAKNESRFSWKTFASPR